MSLLLQYKKLRGTSGIYALIHKPSLGIYIGSSVNIGVRIKAHINSAKRTDGYYVHKSLSRLGVDSFDLELIERCEQPRLLEREYFWIVFYNAVSLGGFNTCKKPKATYGNTFSELSRQRMSLAAKSPENLARLK